MSLSTGTLASAATSHTFWLAWVGWIIDWAKLGSNGLQIRRPVQSTKVLLGTLVVPAYALTRIAAESRALMPPALPASKPLLETATTKLSIVFVWGNPALWNLYFDALRLMAVGPKGLSGTQAAYLAAGAAWVAA